jgi:hypothetical protein
VCKQTQQDQYTAESPVVWWVLVRDRECGYVDRVLVVLAPFISLPFLPHMLIRAPITPHLNLCAIENRSGLGAASIDRSIDRLGGCSMI